MMSMSVTSTITDTVKQEFLEAASYRDAEKMKKMLRRYGDDLAKASGQVQHVSKSLSTLMMGGVQALAIEGNALHQVAAGGIFREDPDGKPTYPGANACSTVPNRVREADGKKMVRCVRLLTDHGCDVNYVAPNGWRPLHRFAFQSGGDVSVRAVSRCVAKLVEKGADPLVFTEDMESPLAICRDDRLKSDLTKVFEKAHPNYKKGLAETRKKLKREISLTYAILEEDMEKVDRILGKGVEFRTRGPNSPLVVALAKGAEDVFIRLVEAGADVHGDFTFPFGDQTQKASLLVLAYRLDRLGIFKFLLSKGLDPNERFLQVPESAWNTFSSVLWHGMVVLEDLPYLSAVMETGKPLNYETPTGQSILSFLGSDRSSEAKTECDKMAATYRRVLEPLVNSTEYKMEARIFEALAALEMAPSLEEGRRLYREKIQGLKQFGMDSDMAETIVKVFFEDFGKSPHAIDKQLYRHMWEKALQWAKFLEGATPRHELAKTLLKRYQQYTDPSVPSNPQKDLIAAMLARHQKEINAGYKHRSLCRSKKEFRNAVDDAVRKRNFKDFERLILSHPMLKKKVHLEEVMSAAAYNKRWGFIKKLLSCDLPLKYREDDLSFVLREAEKEGRQDLVTLLRKHGAQ